MIHLVVGPPCAGKSTFVETNAIPGAPRFDFDAVASSVAGVDVRHDVPAEVAEVTQAMRRGLFGWLLDSETEVKELWLVVARPAPSTVEQLRAKGLTVHVVDPGEEECLARAIRQGRSDRVMEAIKAWYANPPDFGEKGAGVEMKQLHASVETKAADQDTGVIEAYAAVFDNIDSYGDVLRKGAFEESLKEWEESGRTIPLLYGHDFSDPFSNIGAVTKAVEDDHGLLIEAKFDMDNPKAAQVFRLVREKRLSEMSFAFQTLDAAEAEVDGKFVYELRKVKLYEASVVPIGANSQTEILSVKRADEAMQKAESAMACAKRALDAVTAAAEAKDSPGGTPPGAEQETKNPGDEPGFFYAKNSGRVNALKAQILILEGEM